MATDLPGLAIVAGLLLPVLAAAAWAIVLERRPRPGPAEPESDPDWTVAGIQARLRFEQAARRFAEAGTIALPTLPIPEQLGRESSPDRLPWRLPRTIPPPRPAAKAFSTSGAIPVSRFAFAPPDNDLMRRILDGLRKMD
jgi:hypothetical protein